MKHWLFKSEPGAFSYADLEASQNRTTGWDSIRNYQARNMMRDEMSVGDPVLFYHSQTGKPAVVGVAEVASTPYPDPTQFDPDSRYFDAKATLEVPRWFQVDIRALRPLERPVTLAELRNVDELGGMYLLRRGNRLSIQPVTEREFRYVLSLAAG